MGSRIGPNVYITNFPREASRSVWKWYYRKMRVIVRENEKAAVDMVTYGSGYVKTFDDGSDPQHVPIKDVRIKW